MDKIRGKAVTKILNHRGFQNKGTAFWTAQYTEAKYFLPEGDGTSCGCARLMQHAQVPIHICVCEWAAAPLPVTCCALSKICPLCPAECCRMPDTCFQNLALVQLLSLHSGRETWV